LSYTWTTIDIYIDFPDPLGVSIYDDYDTLIIQFSDERVFKDDENGYLETEEIKG
jgi:hypothetical protein